MGPQIHIEQRRSNNYRVMADAISEGISLKEVVDWRRVQEYDDAVRQVV
jgi:hypothetical protein